MRRLLLNFEENQSTLFLFEIKHFSINHSGLDDGQLVIPDSKCTIHLIEVWDYMIKNSSAFDTALHCSTLLVRLCPKLATDLQWLRRLSVWDESFSAFPHHVVLQGPSSACCTICCLLHGKGFTAIICSILKGHVCCEVMEVLLVKSREWMSPFILKKGHSSISTLQQAEKCPSSKKQNKCTVLNNGDRCGVSSLCNHFPHGNIIKSNGGRQNCHKHYLQKSTEQVLHF